MKHISTICLILSVLAIVLMSNHLFHPAVPVKAVGEEAIQVEMAVPVMEATGGGAVTKSEYTLPYPGILHNHPLYFLKEFRDKVIEMLIVDPARKADFYLLQSDKWIGSAAILAKTNAELSQNVLNQSAERMGLAVSQLTTMKQNNREVNAGTIEKFTGAVDKHLEIVDEMTVEKKVDTSGARATYIKAQEELTKLR